MEVGDLRTYLLYTWVTVFFFNLAIPAGKVAVSAYLIEMNGQGSETPRFLFPLPLFFFFFFITWTRSDLNGAILD